MSNSVDSATVVSGPKRLKLQRLLQAELRLAADPAKARPMQAYMKSSMPYYGVQTVPLRAICKRIFDSNPIRDQESWMDQCLGIWRGAKYREEWYASIELTGHRYYHQYQTRDTLPMYEEMIVTGAWWDVVDVIASHRLGDLLRTYPRFMRAKMLAWSRSDSVWKRRSAIICQMSFKSQTDLPLLYACIEPSIESEDFFLRKAIGWALRQYAWTDPMEVKRYVQGQQARLSALTQREALKNLRN